MSPPYDALEAAQALSAADPALAEWIARVGPPHIEITPDEMVPALLRSITYQQLSTKAAATIHGRVLEAFGSDALEADALAQALVAADDDAIRACGMSRAKTAAVKDLSARHLDGSLPTRAALLEMPDLEVAKVLTAVRGVGVWTAQMVMIFNLGRADVWPVADLGVQEGMRIVHSLEDRPTAREMAPIGEPYAPWRSVAAWYGWRAVHVTRGEE